MIDFSTSIFLFLFYLDFEILLKEGKEEEKSLKGLG